MASHFKLISHKLCPYVQRSVITLEEKQIPYERIDVDPTHPSPWFTQVSPMGKVPILIVDNQHVLFESMVITEYLDEITEGSLHPLEPLTKAQHRAWIEFASQLLNTIAKLYNVKDEIQFKRESDVIRSRLRLVETKHSGKTYFEGEQFYLIDGVYATVFRYFDVVEKHINLQLFEDLNKLKNWQTTIMQRSTVKHAVGDNYSEKLIEFIIQRNGYLAQLLTKRSQGL